MFGLIRPGLPKRMFLHAARSRAEKSFRDRPSLLSSMQRPWSHLSAPRLSTMRLISLLRCSNEFADPCSDYARDCLEWLSFCYRRMLSDAATQCLFDQYQGAA